MADLKAVYAAVDEYSGLRDTVSGVLETAILEVRKP